MGFVTVMMRDETKDSLARLGEELFNKGKIDMATYGRTIQYLIETYVARQHKGGDKE